MTIKTRHFDTLTRQDLDIEESIKNSLAEYLFPDTKFAIGSIYQDISIPEHLNQYEDKTLQFASGERMFFADSSVRSLVYPRESDGSSYGSLVFTPCQSFQEVNAKVLIINDETGANGGIMPPETAKEIVGDCYGKVSSEIAEKLTGVDNTPFQFRLGIKPQEESSVYRIGKGTLAPAALDNLSGTKVVTTRSDQGKLIAKTGYDFILPTSSFKGRKEGYAPIEPGEYHLKIGIGIKTLAQYGEQSLGTQVLVNYPRGVSSELLPPLEEKAKDLAEKQSSPQKLAQHFIEVYERRKEAMRVSELNESNFNYDRLEGLDQAIDQAFGDEEAELENTAEQDWVLYRLLKADIHGKISEHPKIVDQLNKFVRNEWKDIATGRAIKFQAGLAQPSLKLKEDEICIPHIPPGKEVLVTRSPLINSNGVIVLTNRHLPEVKHLQGVVHINPVTAAKELLGDFDGDRIAFETADKYPVLAAEVKEYNLEQNRYPDIVKKDKIAYKGTFQEIALSAAENKIGLIANQIQRAVSNRWETYALPDAQKPIYLRNISEKMKGLLEDDSVTIPEKYLQRITQLANFPQKASRKEIEQGLDNLRTINFDLVSDLGKELQVAVDGPKSAARPDDQLLNTLNAIGKYKYPQWLYDKKNPKAYLDRAMKTSGYSPIDLMIKQTNETFKTSQLSEAPTPSFRPLFEDIPFSERQKQKAIAIKNTYNDLIGRAMEAQKKSEQPVLKVTSATSGKTIQISDLKSINLIHKAKQLDVGIRAHPQETKQNQGTLRAVVIQANGIERDIGIVSAEQVKEFGLKHGHSLRGAAVNLDSGITKAQVKALFSEASDYLEKVRQETPESEKTALNSALWHVVHTRSKGDKYNKKGTVALNLFTDEVVKQLEKPPVLDLTVVGVLYSEDYGDKIWKGETVNCEIAKSSTTKYTTHSDKRVMVEGKSLGALTIESSSFQTGTKFRASITTPLGSSVMATTPRGNSIKIGEVKNGAYPQVSWKGEKTTIKLDWQWMGDKRRPVALLNGKRLGVLDKKSAEAVEAKGLITKRQVLPVTLVRSPAKAVNLKVDLNTVVYPWQQQLDNKVEPIATATAKPTPAPKVVTKPPVEQSRASIVAPIVNDFLRVKNSEEYEGKKYNAAWKNNILILSTTDGSTLLEAQKINGQWQSKPDNLTQQDVEFFQGLKPKIAEQLAEKEARQQVFRQEYDQLRSQVQSDPKFKNESPEKVDMVVAMFVIDNENNPKNRLHRVAEVLSQSDTVLELKKSLQMSDYLATAREYVTDKFESALQVRKTLGLERRRSFDLSL
ncbi:MAG: hypothetical protein QNJ32_28085 [Xenococcaceae cyanobacterium MO_167.B27]|nr:hypothetical protein [Xenococcaceae cyanobacterium MO_167.B27]